MTEHTLSVDHHPTLRHVDREAIGIELQAILTILIDLSLTGKHAHWNVQGPNFRSLHLFLDEMIDAWREAADAVGERAVALGHAPDGRATTVAERTELPQLEAGPQLDRELIGALTRILTEAIGAIRTRMDQLEDVDAVTADILHGVVAKLEEQAWMIRVQGA
jgi:starvation-inducible DNA-binding protein